MTVDDLMASVVAVAGSDDHGISTAFVVHGPNRLIAEGWSVARELTAKGRLKVMTRDGHRLEAKVLHHDQTHPFGPLFAEVPSGLSVPGLALATVAPGRGAAVRMAVAAGSRVGISDGRIIEPKEQRLTIEPIGLVDGLVAIDGVVRPGASGAPVVDAAFNVVGYIVAGSDKPPCFMYPSTRWSEGLG